MRISDQHTLKHNKRWLRSIVIVAGILWFVWIGIEDPGTITVLLLSAVFMTVLAIAGFQRITRQWPKAGTRRIVVTLLIGLICGLLVTPVAVLLMAVKISLHNHVVPDFTRGDVVQVLRSTPYWALGALLIATGSALYDHLRT